MTHRQQTHSVKVGNVTVGGGAPIVVQSMTNTDTADVASTVQQCLELASGRLGNGPHHRERSRSRRRGRRKSSSACSMPAATLRSSAIFTTTATSC